MFPDRQGSAAMESQIIESPLMYMISNPDRKIAPFRWSYGLNAAAGSKETTTFGKTHPNLLKRVSYVTPFTRRLLINHLPVSWSISNCTIAFSFLGLSM